MGEARSERRAVAVATAVAALMIAQQIAGKATRDAFFLSNFSVSALPVVMIASAALSLVVVLAVSRALRSMSPAKAVPWIFAINASFFALEYVLSKRVPRVAAVVVYLHMAALGAAAISTFWSVINERFNPRQAKRAIARVGIGATFGGVIGGLVAWLLADRVEIQALLAILAAANVVCAIGIAAIGRSSAPVVDGKSASALRVLRETPYLRQLALLVGLSAVAEAIVDFVLKASAQAEFATSEELVTFFALFYMASGVLAFFVQTMLAGRALRTIGLTGSVATRAGTFLGGGLFALAFPGLWAMALFSGASNTIENSLYRSGYEILYTPLTPQKKRPTKTFIDVSVEKLGVALGSGLVLLVVALEPSQPLRILLGGAAVMGMLAVLVCTRLHGGYVDALADSLRAGRVQLDIKDSLDRTTRSTISQTNTELGRAQLLKEIEAHRASSIDPVPEPDRVLAAVADLRSLDPVRARRRLAECRPVEPALIAHVLPLLEQDDRGDVISALEEVAEQVVGQLDDALRAAALPIRVRQGIAIVLAKAQSPRAVRALVAGLADEAFDVRRQCGRSLDRQRMSQKEPSFDRDQILAHVRQEAGREDDVQTEHRLSQVVRLLSLVLDRETIRLAARALETSDDALRGTALEYLENVVPAETFSTLAPLFRAVPRRSGTRPKGELVRDLLRTVDTEGINTSAIRSESGLNHPDSPGESSE